MNKTVKPRKICSRCKLLCHLGAQSGWVHWHRQGNTHYDVMKVNGSMKLTTNQAVLNTLPAVCFYLFYFFFCIEFVESYLTLCSTIRQFYELPCFWRRTNVSVWHVVFVAVLKDLLYSVRFLLTHLKTGTGVHFFFFFCIPWLWICNLSDEVFPLHSNLFTHSTTTNYPD